MEIVAMNLSGNFSNLTFNGTGFTFPSSEDETIMHNVLLALCICGFIANTICIAATAHIPRGVRTTHSKLIISLCVSDLLVVISILLFVLHSTNTELDVWPPPTVDDHGRIVTSCITAVLHCFYNFSFMLTLLNLITMAVDHHMAIMKPLRYSNLMSNRKGRVIVGIIWLLAFLTAVSNFIAGAMQYENNGIYTYCEYILFDSYDTEHVIIGLTLFCLLVIVLIYGTIYYEIKKMNYRTKVISKDGIHSKKGLITTLLIIGTFALCWLPNCIFQIIMLVKVKTDPESVLDWQTTLLKINSFLFLLQVVNSICDPLIYAIRLKDVQRGYKIMAKRMLKRGLWNSFREGSSFTSFGFSSFRNSVHRNPVRESVTEGDGDRDSLRDVDQESPISITADVNCSQTRFRYDDCHNGLTDRNINGQSSGTEDTSLCKLPDDNTYPFLPNMDGSTRTEHDFVSQGSDRLCKNRNGFKPTILSGGTRYTELSNFNDVINHCDRESIL